MSRIGKKPVTVPSGVEINVSGQKVSVKGKNGQLHFEHHPDVTVAWDESARELSVTRADDSRLCRSLHGLTRSLIDNMVTGVETYFEKRLEIQGVGYNATIRDGILELQVGFANTVRLRIPDGVVCETPDATHVIVKSADKQKVGQFASDIRRVRPPEPYKGKGIRYQGEHVKRKSGKAFAGGK